MTEMLTAYRAGYENWPGKYADNPYPDGSTDARVWVDGFVHRIIDERVAMQNRYRSSDSDEVGIV